MTAPAPLWLPVKDGDFRVLGHYSRHYSSSKSRPRRVAYEPLHVVGPGEKYVMLTVGSDALFVWRREQFRRDVETGVECAVFHNESDIRSSTLIREASRLALERWPGERLFTFVDPAKVRSSNPGYCFIAAGWARIERTTARGLRVLELLP